jgi:uncharacterized damage-inducible protein DinB
MFVDLVTDPREDPPAQGDERQTLLGFLRWQRQTLQMKCAGLDAEQLARRAVEPSTLSLLGLLRHTADVERGWFRQFMAGEPSTPHFRSAAEPDGDFDGAAADSDLVTQALAVWQDEIAHADQFVADAPGLNVLSAAVDPDRGRLSLRWVLVHMIEEYARHNGHADLLRERIDGRLGQ